MRSIILVTVVTSSLIPLVIFVNFYLLTFMFIAYIIKLELKLFINNLKLYVIKVLPKTELCFKKRQWGVVWFSVLYDDI